MQDSLLQLIYTVDEHYQFSLNAQQLLGNATSTKIPFNPFLQEQCRNPTPLHVGLSKDMQGFSSYS